MARRKPDGFRPDFDGQICSLGYQLIDWIEAYCCHGPGDIQGDAVEVDDEWFDFIVAAYELDPSTGARQKDRALLSRPKGRAKSELAGWLVVAEALGPVRFDGWDAAGQPVGKPVRSPLIKCLATEESQAGNTFEVAAFIAGQWGPDEHPEVYRGISGARQYQSATALYLPGGGEMRACTSGAASKDGGKETFVVPDEVHLYVLPELRNMYATVARNTGKRGLAEPWMLLTTTMYRAGEQSVGEKILRAWRKGELENPDRWLVDHREASGRIDIGDKAHTLRQLREVYGSASWIDVDRVYRTMRDPNECEDEATAARYFLNREIPGSDAWIATGVMDAAKRVEAVEPGTAVALGFDGSLNDDATVLIGCRMSDGFLFPIGIWGPPTAQHEAVAWQVPRADVLATVREAFGRYDVARMYADPHEWRSDIDALAEGFGESRVLPWETRRDVQMAAALDRLHVDLISGKVQHSGDPRLLEHFGNAYVRRKGGHRLVRKEHDKSPRKIDSVVGAALAYEARADAIAAGWGNDEDEYAYA